MKAQVNSAEYLRHHHSDHSFGGVGKVHKKSKKEEKESQEIKAYLTKLQELVPFTPKNKKLSKLEVISYVIDYIQDLRETLGLPPSPCQNNGSDHLDEKFTWLLNMESTSSTDHHNDLYEQHDDSSSPAEIPPLTEYPATMTAAATITVTSGSVTSSPQHFQHRQPLCVISKPGGNTDFVQTHLSSSSVKSSTVLSSASTNCGQVPQSKF